MTRYIDGNALKERLEDFSKWCKDGRKQGVDFVLDCPLPNTPTADVAPRAEVAREIFWELDKLLLSITIDEENEESFVGFDFDKYLALKKKYLAPDTNVGRKEEG
jgi:hypothetical protein